MARWGIAAGVVVALALGAGAYWQQVTDLSPQNLPLPEDAIAWPGGPGQQLLAVAEGTADHEALTTFQQPQERATWCGVASAATVLSAARGEPVTQTAFFTPEVTAVRAQWRTTLTGMTLDALGGMLRAHGVDAATTHAEDASEDAFRAVVADNLATTGDWLIVNYHRAHLDEAGGGHISPLSAYDADSDRVLLLDTAAHKYPPHWVAVADLYSAMNTPDSESGRSRGWVVVRE